MCCGIVLASVVDLACASIYVEQRKDKKGKKEEEEEHEKVEVEEDGGGEGGRGRTKTGRRARRVVRQVRESAACPPFSFHSPAVSGETGRIATCAASVNPELRGCLQRNGLDHLMSGHIGCQSCEDVSGESGLTHLSQGI